MFKNYLTKTGRLSNKQPQDVKNQWYIEKFKEVHGAQYDYSNVIYVSQLQKVEIICKQHGPFLQSPNHHLNGRGCPLCSGNARKTTEQCIEEFVQKHGHTYDYSQVTYTSIRTKVKIICTQHGGFFQTPQSHALGRGCPKCQTQNQDTIYLLRCLTTGLVKIGITNNIYKRITSIGGTLEPIYHTNCSNPRQLEKSLHQEYKDFQVFNPTVKSGGTEFFQLSESQVLNIIQFLSSV